MKSRNATKNRCRKLAESDYRTFGGWRAVGRHVIKGQKAARCDKDGRPLFHLNQTAVSIMFMTDGKGEWDIYEEGHNVPNQDINDSFFSDGYMDSVGDR